MGLSYAGSSIVFLGLLTAILIFWYVKEKTLSIHSIFTWRREAFYWAAVLVTFTLGTAVGDMTAETFEWGTLYSGIIFTAAILLPLLGIRFFRLNKVIAFWFSYILTRPLGASFADWLSQPPQRGGIGFGLDWISLILLVAIIALVTFLSTKSQRIQAMLKSTENFSAAE
jgi:uncharacterized membrane-anchored protein